MQIPPASHDSGKWQIPSPQAGVVSADAVVHGTPIGVRVGAPKAVGVREAVKVAVGAPVEVGVGVSEAVRVDVAVFLGVGVAGTPVLVGGAVAVAV